MVNLNKMFSFNSQFLKVDVTAVKIQNNFFLVGVGGFLIIFDKKTSSDINKVPVFDGQKIYGIILNKSEDKILLYGAKYMKLFSVDKTLIHFDEISQTIASDWILDAKWIDDDKKIATVSMHNKLHIWNESLEQITKIECEEKCILYSAHICYEKMHNLIILSGTVFNEVLIWKPKWAKSSSAILKRLQKHNGVIFSIHYNETSGYICSSSDDRSAVLWKVKSKNLGLEVEQKNIQINPTCQVFGHLSRVFRCQVLKNCFITGGEDSLSNIWSFDGQLIRKVETHQGGPIWALDCDEENNFILTGGGDCGVTTFPIYSEFVEQQVLLSNNVVPKAVGILASNNLVVLSENGVLHYIKRRQQCEVVKTHEDLKSYALLVLSNCKRLIALAGFNGQIYIYKEINNSELKQTSSFQTKVKTRIYSIHWLSCTSFLICQAEGKITVLYLKSDNILPITSFILPPSKERWSTSAVFIRNMLVVGDRKGNIHLFQFGKIDAVQSIKRAHSYLGVTNIISETNDTIKSLGRNGVVKTFLLKNGTLCLLSTEKLPFTWLVDIIDTLLLAFSGDNFIIWSYLAKRIVFEKSCGGGHRSWDFLKNLNTATFCYIKDKTVNTVDFKPKNVVPVDVIQGYHIKEVNSIVTIQISDKFLVISGGEDTTLRIDIADASNINNLISLKSHLSSIRTITKFKINDETVENTETYLLFSAGGRAQIVCWKLSILTQNGVFQDVICSEEHSYHKPIHCEESETRIMDLCVTKIDNNLTLLAACSDGNIKVFSVTKNNDGRYHLTFYIDIFYTLKCILKLQSISSLSHNIIVSMATDGKLAFWDVTSIFKNKHKFRPVREIQAHQSGINSSAYKLLKNDLCLFMTGGDDNAIVLNLIRISLINDALKIETIHSLVDTSIHCTQVTGIFIGETHFVTASIDQRVAIFEWQVQTTKIVYKYISKYNTSVADVQGLDCFEFQDISAFVYGKGIEYIKIKKKP